MKLWFDIESRELVTEDQLRKEYAESWLPERVKEEGLVYVVENAEDFTFEAWVRDCLCSCGGTLVPVYNAEYFKEVEPNA